MKDFLYSKFILSYTLFGLVAFVVISAFSARLTRDYLVRQNAKLLYDEAILMADAYEENPAYLTSANTSVSSQLLIVSRFISSSVWLVDKDGKIIMNSDNTRNNGRVISNFDPTEENESYIIGNYHGFYQEPMLTVYAPINYHYTPVGYVLVHMPMSKVTASTNEIMRIVYITAGIVYLLSLLILLIFTFTVYLPLKAITIGAKEYAAGNLGYKIRAGAAEDEMGYLADTLNYMAAELGKSEEYQKNFIANVSHDFRSPLTSIRGYLEAILDGTIPPEMQNKYLERVISETSRLTKLTEGMLTLNSLGSKAQLRRSVFDINRTVKDVCASNENTCMKKEINFVLTFEDESEMVYADYGKIQQVLYNLVDNAIKFSKQGGTIYISTSLRQKKVFVSVKDNGCGIPKNSIKKIWERFYKSDASRGKDKKGTGLGLSIVREIIQAHDETIDVVSTENVGTEFTFSLPLAERRGAQPGAKPSGTV